MSPEPRVAASYKKGLLTVNRLIRVFGLAFLILGLMAARAQADMVITSDNVTAIPGVVTTMDFTISFTSSNASGGTDNTLIDFGLALQIGPIGMPKTSLTFTAAQPDPTSNMGYVFSGNSNDDSLMFPFWSSPTPGMEPVNIFGGDAANTGSATIPDTSSGTSFLAVVQFVAPVGSPQGDRFQISLVGGSYFDGSVSSGLPYSYNPLTPGGVVTIGAASVPEPSSLVMAAIACLGGLLGYRRSRRRG
jgi:hypothetical protein